MISVNSLFIVRYVRKSIARSDSPSCRKNAIGLKQIKLNLQYFYVARPLAQCDWGLKDKSNCTARRVGKDTG